MKFFFIFYSLFIFIICLGAFFSFDPLKSCLLLILSLLLSSGGLSSSFSIWLGYFVSLLFLSGVFVILVYFSSLSNFSQHGFNKSYIFFFFFFFHLILFEIEFNLNLISIYYGGSVIYFLLILSGLILFLFFLGIFINFSGALRKI